ncbi:nicotinate phosphoribosyltransferase [Beduini massiliensis]|uniref:nicotinate phosphoribosyltransferase n=1 Tax=Beduini massiliensis TaxID=1585974 RepID=UPI00059A9710|nr:nicotinate phosphoribosyltransferase [Beduini massiliensis]
MNQIQACEKRNLTLVMDLYELTMAYNYYKNGLKDRIVYFDMYYRKNPDEGGYVIFAGLEQVIECIKDLHFSKGDIDYLRSLHLFDEEFLGYLSTLHFTGNLYSVKEGTPVFPNEPLMTIEAKIIEAQLIETVLLVTVNHQSLIATKAHRIVMEAKGRPIMEFGARRAQGYDGATYGARAAYIGGVAGTATVSAGEAFGIPVVGTMAHSFVQLFDTEYEAFATYARTYPDNCVLLVDTYDVLKLGVPNAIKVAQEVLIPMGKRLAGIRIDSGDIAYLSKKARMMLDVAGLHDCKITASNSLDEYIIRSLLNQGAQIDSFGVGENLIVSKSAPVFGGVYKLVATTKENGEIVPKIKISENTDKITNPGYKKVYRLFDKETNKAIADLIASHDEIINPLEDITIYHQSNIWKNKTIEAGTYEYEELQVPIFKDGQLVYPLPTINEIRQYAAVQAEKMWDEIFRLEYPHIYYVDLTKKLLDQKIELLEKNKYKGKK